MTNVMKHSMLCIFAFLIAVTGCQKPAGQALPLPATGNVKLVKVTGDEGTTLLDYNENGTLKSITSVEGNEPVVYTLQYNANKQIASLHSALATINYTYGANGLSRTETYMLNTKAAHTDYIYTNNQPTRIATFSDVTDQKGQPMNIESLRTDFTYNVAGDVKTTVDYIFEPVTKSLHKSATHRFISHDTEKNPASLFGALAISFYAEPNSHNVLQEQVLNENDQLIQTIGYAYTYDANGYPASVKETAIPVSGAATVKMLYYIYK